MLDWLEVLEQLEVWDVLQVVDSVVDSVEVEVENVD